MKPKSRKVINESWGAICGTPDEKVALKQLTEIIGDDFPTLDVTQPLKDSIGRLLVEQRSKPQKKAKSDKNVNTPKRKKKQRKKRGITKNGRK